MYDEAGMVNKKPTKTAVDREIDIRIRELYKETLEEDVPDRFKELIEKLREKEGRA